MNISYEIFNTDFLKKLDDPNNSKGTINLINYDENKLDNLMNNLKQVVLDHVLDLGEDKYKKCIKLDYYSKLPVFYWEKVENKKNKKNKNKKESMRIEYVGKHNPYDIDIINVPEKYICEAYALICALYNIKNKKEVSHPEVNRFKYILDFNNDPVRKLSYFYYKPVNEN